MVELHRDGSKTVYHEAGQRRWTHPHDDPYMNDFEGNRQSGPMVRKPCPGCRRKVPSVARPARSVGSKRPVG